MLNIEKAIWQITMLISSFLVTAIIISVSDAFAFSSIDGYVALPTIAFTSKTSSIFWISSLDWSITVIEWPCSLNCFAIVKPTLPAPQMIIFILIKYFSKKISENYNIKEFEIDENDTYILNHSWKGNVRELKNLIERVAILQPDTKEKISNIIKESLKNENFGNKVVENSLSVPLKEAREKFEKEYLTIQLKKFNGNISKTANFVGMERSALHRKLKGLGIKEFN